MLDGKGNILLPHLDQIQNEMSAATCYAPGKRLSCMQFEKFKANNYSERYTDDIKNIEEEDIEEINIPVLS